MFRIGASQATKDRLDLDLRKVRYFAAVAEELHFGRAAEQLLANTVVGFTNKSLRALVSQLLDGSHHQPDDL